MLLCICKVIMNVIDKKREMGGQSFISFSVLRCMAFDFFTYLMGGPEVQDGLSPTVRQYSRTVIFPKVIPDVRRRCRCCAT